MVEESTLASRIIKWAAGVGTATLLLPGVWSFANYIVHNDHEEVINNALVCSDVDGLFSYTVVRQDFMYMSVTRTHDYFFLQHETFYIDDDGDYLVDTITRRTSMIFDDPQVIRYERDRDHDAHPADFLEADLEYEEQVNRFSLP